MKLRAAQLMEQALQNRAQLEMQQKQFGLQAPQARASNSVRGDTLANLQDATISGLPSRINVPQIGGGLRPSLLSQNSRDLGKDMSRQALMQQLQGDQFTPMPAANIPSITPMPQAGALDKILNTVGVIGTGVGAADQAGLFKRKNPYQVPQVPPMMYGDWQDEGVG
jgi:hypothetical protein